MLKQNNSFLAIGMAISNFAIAQEATAELTIINTTTTRIAGKQFKNADDCSGGRTGFLPGNVFVPGQSVTVTIDASRDLSMFLSTLDKWDVSGGKIQASSCMVPFTFTPRVGEKYSVQFSTTRSEESCRVLLEVITDQGPKEESSFKRRTWRTPWSEDGSFCKPVS